MYSRFTSTRIATNFFAIGCVILCALWFTLTVSEQSVILNRGFESAKRYIRRSESAIFVAPPSECVAWKCTCDGFIEHFAGEVFGWSVRRHPTHDAAPTVASHIIHAPWWLGSACLNVGWTLATNGLASDGPSLKAEQCTAWNCDCQGFSDYFGAGGAGGMGWATANPHLHGWWAAHDCNTIPPSATAFRWAVALTNHEAFLIDGKRNGSIQPQGHCGRTKKFVLLSDMGGVFHLDHKNGVLGDSGFSNTLIAFNNALQCTAKRNTSFGLALGLSSHINLNTAFDLSSSVLQQHICIMSESEVRARHDDSLLGTDALEKEESDQNGMQGWFFAGGCQAAVDKSQRTGEHMRTVLKALFTNPRPSIRRAVDRFIREKLFDANGFIGVHFRAFGSVQSCSDYTQREIMAETQHAGVFDGLSPASLYQLCTMPSKYIATLAAEAGIDDVANAPKFLATDRYLSGPAQSLEAAGYIRYDEKEFSAGSFEGLVIDMLILSRSRFFVGNPASSMAANIVTLRRTFNQVGPRFSNFAMPIELGGVHPFRGIFSGSRRRRQLSTPVCTEWHYTKGEHFVSTNEALGRFGEETTLEIAKQVCCENPKCVSFTFGRHGTGGVYMQGLLHPTLTGAHDRRGGWELRLRARHDGYTKPSFVPHTPMFGRYAEAHTWWVENACIEDASGQDVWDRDLDAKGGLLTLAPDALAFQCWMQAELGPVRSEWSSHVYSNERMHGFQEAMEASNVKHESEREKVRADEAAAEEVQVF